MSKKFLLLTIILTGLGIRQTAQAQTEAPVDLWDNVLYYGNKLAWGSNDWRHSTEFQVRFRDDVSSLEQWHLEYIGTYLATKNLEIVPDFRYTRNADKSKTIYFDN